MESLPFRYQKKDFWEFICPICKTPRRSFYWPKPRPRHYLALVFFSFFVLVCLWPWFDIKGVFMSLPVWAGFEFFYRAKARQSVICSHCGFDPYLYKYDVRLARDKVESFWAKKKSISQKVEETQPTDPKK